MLTHTVAKMLQMLQKILMFQIFDVSCCVEGINTIYVFYSNLLRCYATFVYQMHNAPWRLMPPFKRGVVFLVMCLFDHWERSSVLPGAMQRVCIPTVHIVA